MRVYANYISEIPVASTVVLMLMATHLSRVKYINVSPSVIIGLFSQF